jgi:hypothetical protein
MGTPIIGMETIVGLKKAATWHTAVACGAGDGLLILNETLSQTIEELLDESCGVSFIRRTEQGKRDASGALEAYLRYEGLDVALALIMGTAGTPSQQGSTTAYTNSYVMADNIWGKFATIAMLKQSDKVHEYRSAKPHGFTISGEMNTATKIALNVLADELELASSTNTSATLQNVTYPDEANRVIFNSDATFKINDEDGAALADGDKVYPSGFELAFDRPMESDWVAGASGISEPAVNAFPTATLTLKFPRYDADNHTFFTNWDAFTRKKMEIYFKGALIEDTYYYEFKVSMPNLVCTNGEAAIGFRLLSTDTAPTGMTGITKPFQIDVQNTRTTDPLG